MSDLVEGFDLDAWLRPSHTIPIVPGAGEVLAFTDGEITFHIAERAGVFVAETTERGQERVGEGSFSDLGAAVRFLMLDFGTAQRSTRNLPALDAQLADGFVVEDGPTATHLTWAQGWIELRTTRVIARLARLLSRSIGHSLADLAASLDEPDGSPLFSRVPPRPGTARL